MMFTGIVEEVGKVARLVRIGRGIELSISSNQIINNIKLGDSISVNGICLTVENKFDNTFSVTCSDITLKKTNLRILKVGDKVNLESALTPTSRIGGHFVQGHVDCTGRVVRFVESYPGKKLIVKVPATFTKYTPQGGSIAINGVSLTIAYEHNGEIEILLVPHTLRNINEINFRVGSEVNIEFDCLAKYIEAVFLKGETFHERKLF